MPTIYEGSFAPPSGRFTPIVIEMVNLLHNLPK
jgi:hypothetical protein